jgi:hypothetical protein
MQQQLQSTDKKIVLVLNFNFSNTPQQQKEEKKNWKGRKNCDTKRSQNFEEDKLSHLQQKKKELFQKLEQNQNLEENEKERINRRLSFLNRKIDRFSSNNKEKEAKIQVDKPHHHHHYHRRSCDSRKEGRRSFHDRRGSFFNLEEKFAFLEQKKKLSQLLQENQNLDENKKQRLEKRLSFLNSKLEKLSKEKNEEKCNEKKDNAITSPPKIDSSCSSTPKIDSSSDLKKEKREKRLETLKLKKQFLEKKLEEDLLSSSSSDSNSEGESNKRKELLLSRLSKLNQKIEKLSQNSF